jgi:hypothetical protein
MNADLEKLRQQIRDKAADACFNTQQALDIAHLSMAIVSPEIARLKARIAELEKDSDLLEALRAYGVDNWDGYDDAIQAVAE